MDKTTLTPDQADALIQELEGTLGELRAAMTDVSKSLVKMAKGLGNKSEKEALFALANTLSDTKRSGKYKRTHVPGFQVASRIPTAQRESLLDLRASLPKGNSAQPVMMLAATNKK